MRGTVWVRAIYQRNSLLNNKFQVLLFCVVFQRIMQIVMQIRARQLYLHFILNCMIKSSLKIQKIIIKWLKKDFLEIELNLC